MAKRKEIISQPEEAEVIEKTPTKFKLPVGKIVYWVVILLVAYFVWKNPAVVDKYIDYAKSLNNSQVVEEVEETNIEDLFTQVSQLQNEVNGLRNVQQPITLGVSPEELQKLEARIEAIEKQNLNVIDSKADVATVLGVITRLDKVEEQLDKLAKVTDQGALVLSATMLIKEAADNGQRFEYETEILQLLAKGDVKLNEPIAVIANYAKDGIQTKSYLINEFESIYKSLLKEQKKEFEKTWKDRINSKFNEIVKVKRVNKDAPEFTANKQIELVRNLVKSGNLVKALKELSLIDNKNIQEDKSLTNWIDATKARVSFDEAISKISTYSLALMKVNYIKKGDN